MYAFRKPFSAGVFEEYALWGIDYKILAVTAQIIGYTISKFIGIKVVSELNQTSRIKTVLILIGIAWLALLLFGLFPAPYNVFLLFLNGLPLGMIWGVVFSYLEGRRFTEMLGAGMSASFIVSSGFVKATGRSLVYDYGVSEFWMPFLTGLLYVPALILGVWLLQAIPAPNEADKAARTERVPMTAADRRAFFFQFAPGIIIVVAIYVLLTIFRDIRDNFAVEIWNQLGFSDQPSILATSEIPVAIGVIVIISLMSFIRDNRASFFLNYYVIIFAGFLLLATTYLFTSNQLDPVAWMILNGFSMYLAYIAYHTFLFERWIAAFRYRSNIGFLMYIADAFGYFGSVIVLFARNFYSLDIGWLDFFVNLGYVTGIVIIVLALAARLYFKYKLREVTA